MDCVVCWVQKQQHAVQDNSLHKHLFAVARICHLVLLVLAAVQIVMPTFFKATLRSRVPRRRKSVSQEEGIQKRVVPLRQRETKRPTQQLKGSVSRIATARGGKRRLFFVLKNTPRGWIDGGRKLTAATCSHKLCC